MLVITLGLATAQAEPAVEKYRFSVAVRTSEMSVAESTMPDAQWEVAGTLSLTATHRNRDGSIGYRVNLETASEEGQPSPLQGRSFGFRAFSDGEILDMSDGEHIAGWRSRGDLIDLLMPLLSPAPPKGLDHASGHRRLIWPVRVGTAVRWDNAVEADWTIDTGPEETRLSYSGPYTLAGSDRRPGGRLLFGATGRLSGTLVQRADGAWSHEILLVRQVHIEVGRRAPVVQEQEIRARIEGDRLGKIPREQGPAPAARYLNLGRVQPVVQKLPVGFAECEASQDALTLPVRVRITGAGDVGIIGAQEVPECISRCIEALVFPAHDGPPLEVRFTVYRRGGRLTVSPVVALIGVPVGPVLIHPIGGASTVTEASLSSQLGHPIGQ
jgi:hypothetical protein